MQNSSNEDELKRQNDNRNKKNFNIIKKISYAVIAVLILGFVIYSFL